MFKQINNTHERKTDELINELVLGKDKINNALEDLFNQLKDIGI